MTFLFFAFFYNIYNINILLYFRTYDPMKSLQIMNEAGLMESYN